MLDALLDVRDAVRDLDPELVAQRRKACRCGWPNFSKRFCIRTATIPLLGDSAFDEVAVCPAIDSAGDRPAGIRDGDPRSETAVPPRRQRLGDYWSWRAAAISCCSMADRSGPDHLPAHAQRSHDIRGLDRGRRLYRRQRRTSRYRDDELRESCRSTAAHNVLQIDGREQCDTWSRFRMGYRGHPTPLETGIENGFDWARAGHDAYRRLGIPARRTMDRLPAGWAVADRRLGAWAEVDTNS